MSFDFFDEEESEGSEQNEPEVVQRLERSLNFWATGREDYPPAIRGVIAQLTDLRPDVQKVIAKIGRDKENEDLMLTQVLWFEDKNDKLDDACEEAKIAFRPFKTNEDGLISTGDVSNPLLEKPTRHRLVVSEEFAKTNYDRPSDDLFLDDEDDLDEEVEVGPNSWKRKITQTLKPWAVRKDGEIVRARAPDDLMIALNALMSRTKHGWLLVDLFKLKKRRGSILTYARTYEYQKKDDQQFEFLLELFGAAAEHRARLAKTLANVGSLFLEIDEDGEIYVTKVSTQPVASDSAAKQIEIPLEARVVQQDGKPSQLVLKKAGNYYDAKLKPLVDQGKKLSTKIDLSKSATEEKSFRFNLRVDIDGPLLVASSGNAVLFQLNDFLMRFCETTVENPYGPGKKRGVAAVGCGLGIH